MARFGVIPSHAMPTKKGKAPRKKKTDDVKLRITIEDKARFQEAARRKGLSLSSWLRMVATEAADDQGGRPV